MPGFVQRQIAGTLARKWARDVAPEPDLLKRQGMRPVDDWRRVDGDRAARLGPRETIRVDGGRLGRSRDPLQVNTGWLATRSVLGALGWASAVGASWWLGRHGRGPLRVLDRDG